MMFQAITVLAVAGLAFAAPSQRAQESKENSDWFLPAAPIAAAPVYAAPVATYAAGYVAPVAPIATYAASYSTGYIAPAVAAPVAYPAYQNNYYDSYRPNNAYAHGGRSDSDASVINNIEVVS